MKQSILVLSLLAILSGLVSFRIMTHGAGETHGRARAVSRSPIQEGSEFSTDGKEFTYARRYDPDTYNDIVRRIRQMPSENSMDLVHKGSRTTMSGSSTAWQCVGPAQVIDLGSPSVFFHGRFRSFQWYYNTSSSLWERYAGASSGGLWYGQVVWTSVIWTSLGDNLPNPSVAAFAIDPAHADTIFVGTGDLNRFNGSGVYKTTDRGGSWTLLPLPTTPRYITSMVFTAGAVVGFVASTSGLFKTTDGGSSWSLIPIKLSDSSAQVFNLVKASPLVLYATLGWDGIYKTTNGGASWVKLTSGLPTSNIGQTIALDVSPGELSGDVLYAAYTDTNSNGRGIFKSTNSGVTWTQTSQTPDYIVNGQGNHTNVIKINPNNPNIVYAGSVGMIKSVDGGGSWNWIQSGHGDNTVIDFSPYDVNKMTICNDGGIFDRDDAADTVSNFVHVFTPGAVIQEYGMDYAESESGVMMSGTQDNGDMMTTTASGTPGIWWQIAGCDGGNIVSIDPLNSSHFYTNGWCGTTFPRVRSLDKGATIDDIDQGLNQYWMNPIVISKGGGQVLFTATSDGLYYSYTAGNSWNHATANTLPDFAAGPPVAIAVGRNSTLSNKTVYAYFGDNPNTPVNESETFYAAEGGPGSMVWRSGSMLGYPVDKLIPDRWSADGVFGVYYNALFYSGDRGKTWSLLNVIGPGGHINDVVVSPTYSKAIYVGTDFGVFKSLDGGATWFTFQNGLPIVPISNMVYVPGLAWDTLRIGTYGRCFWERLVRDYDPKLVVTQPFNFPLNGLGVGNKKGLAVGDSGAIVQSTDNGTSWSLSGSGLTSNLRRAAVLDTLHSIAVGDGGTLIRSTDGGQHWIPTVGITGSDIHDMRFIDPMQGWFITADGHLLHTMDGGLDWALAGNFSPQNLQSCFFTDPLHGWVVGADPAGGNAQLHITMDGGNNWQPSISLGVPFVNRLQFVDPLHGFGACNGGIIIKTTDGGNTWTSVPTGGGNLRDCYFTDATNGWMGGDGGTLLRTENGGNDWSELNGGTTQDVRALNPLGSQFIAVGNEGITSFNQSHGVSLTYNLATAWNLVSLPIFYPDDTLIHILPGASAVGFSYDNGYVASPTIDPGKGYWVRCPNEIVSSIRGFVPPAESIQLLEGWNLVSSFSVVVAPESLTIDPPGILGSSFFGFSGSYNVVSRLLPGQAYWIKATQAGTLTIGGAAGSARALSKPTKSANLSAIRFLDAAGHQQTLYYSGSQLRNYALPPMPPPGAFDVRFADGTYGSQIDSHSESALRVTLTSIAYPLTISWSPVAGSPPAELNIDGKIYDLAQEHSVELTAAPRQVSLMSPAGMRAIPTSFSLEQNYPDPFNPSTTIQYDLPEKSNVRIEVYDLTGRLVSTLVDGVKDGGQYDIRWDARSVASGVYFCRMNAVSAAEPSRQYFGIKKMVVLK